MAESSLRAGFAEVDITPAPPAEVAGSFFPRPMEGVLDPLFARAAVLESDGTCLVFISADLLCLDRQFVLDVRRDLEQRLGISAGGITLVATHTHTGPYTSSLLGQQPSQSFLESLRIKIVGVTCLAHRRREPVQVGVSSAFEGGISFNRRWVMKDGLVRTHPARGSVDLSHVEGPVDPEVGVIGFLRLDGTLAGCFVNFACHPNVVRGNRISADYPGALSRAIKRKFGPQSVTLFGNGASGNICQIDVTRAERNDKGPLWAKRMGRILAAHVATRIEKALFCSSAKLSSTSRVVQLQLRDPELVPYHGTMFSGTPYKEIDEIYEREQEELRRRIRQNPLVEIEIQGMRIGRAALVMIPAELFVELGLEVKLRSPWKPTYVLTEANGDVGYVPTRHAFERGGYEVRTGMRSQFVPEAGEEIVEAALDVLSALDTSLGGQGGTRSSQ